MLFFNTNRKYIISMLSIFDNIVTQKSDGRETKVPIYWASQERLVQYLSKRNTSTKGSLPLPAMSLEQTGLVYDSPRKTNKLIQIPISKDMVTGDSKHQYNSVPYNFEFMLTVKTKTMSDIMQILEQILPQFNPSVSLDVKEFPDGSTSSITIVMLSVDVDYESDLQEETDQRMMTATLQFVLKGNIYMPITDTKTITNIEHQFGTLTPENLHNKYIIDENTIVREDL